jgi:S-layer homology domain
MTVRARLLRGLLVAVLAGGLLPLAPGLASSPAGAGRTFGSSPLDDVLYWAGQEARCGLTQNKLAALILAPTWPETGAPATAAPSPMTLSRWDDQASLYAFGVRGQYPRAFWHPGVGMWQYDSAGLGAPYTAAQRIDTFVVAASAADVIASRWCVDPRRSYVWAPWVGCGTTTCRNIYDAIYRGATDQLVGLDRDTAVGSRGGMERRQCRGPGRTGEFLCWRVDPSRAQGYDGFTAPGFGPAPITAPFYVYAGGGQEYRHWLRRDTGYDIGIWATRPLGSNARTSLTWHQGEPLVEVGGGGAGFVDVPENAWYLDALRWAVDNGVVSGFPDQTFRPGDPVNRAQAVSWLWKLAGQPDAPPSGFDDVPDNAWYADAVGWAVQEGLVTGFRDGTFRPMEPVTRGQLAAMLWHLAGEPAGNGPTFSDVRSSAWYAPAISWLTGEGYATGFPDGTFRPRDPANRAQGVSWLYNSRHA